MSLSRSAVKWLIGVGVFILVAITTISIFSGAYNRVVTLEENINTSSSNISKEELRRVDLFNNLVDAVQSYRNFEQDTLTQVTQARQQGNGGNVEQAMLTLAAVVEAYPELKAMEAYKLAMTEFSVTENRIAGYREQYNDDVRSYNRMVRSFPTNIVLGVMGYDKQDFKYLEYDVDPQEHRDLFNEQQ